MNVIAKVDESKCRACGCCVRSCPLGKIELGRYTAQMGENCTGCGRCVSACPFEAIYLENK